MPKEYHRQPLWDPNSPPGSSQGDGFQHLGANPAKGPTFTAHELLDLQILRNRYSQSQDVLTEREQKNLEFLRWLREKGDLPS